MAKPSMFSSNYDKKMKKRRTLKFIIILLLILLPTGGFVYKTSMRGIQLALSERAEKKQVDENNKEQNKSTVENENKVEEKQEDTPSNENVVISDKVEVTLVIKEESGKRVISDVLTKDSLYKNISPNRERAVIIDKEQNTFIINNEKQVTNITYKEYLGPDKTVYKKDSVLKQYTNYIWSKDPVFINDDTIAYMSQLPWFGKEEQYLWLYSLKDNKHTAYYKVFGKQIEYKGMKDDGFEIKMDSKTVLIKKDGTVTNR